MISTEVKFGSVSSTTDLNLIFTHAVIGTPEVRMEYVEVPGRSPVDLSELMLGKPQYNMREITVEFEYKGLDWADEMALVFAKLHGRKMDIRFLTDPSWYYTGRCIVTVEPNLSTLHFTVTITADPFKRVYNELPTTLAAPGNVVNPTLYDSSPLIRVNGTGAGTLTVGNNTVTLDAIDGYVDIDSELMDCYKGLVNCNGDVTMSEFPTLAPGTNAITWSGGVTSVVVTGRWHTL